MPLRLLCLHGWGTNQKVSDHSILRSTKLTETDLAISDEYVPLIPRSAGWLLT